MEGDKEEGQEEGRAGAEGQGGLRKELEGDEGRQRRRHAEGGGWRGQRKGKAAREKKRRREEVEITREHKSGLRKGRRQQIVSHSKLDQRQKRNNATVEGQERSKKACGDFF